MEYLSEKQIIKVKIEKHVILWFKRIYVLAGNIYAWFWLIRAVFFQETSFEDYLMWMFLTAGFYWFIQEHPEIFFKIKDKKD